MPLDKQALAAHVDASRPRFEQALKSLVEIPSVSMDPDHRASIDRCADAAAALLAAEGASAEIVQTAGFPVVLGHFKVSPRAPTVTIYNHLDVQPAGGPEWTREPFTMTTEGDRWYARGATDDKGPALAALFAASFAAKSGIPLNIRFLWETEEEIGSPNFEGFLKKRAKSIATDSVLVSDTIWVSRQRPAISLGLRGLQGAILRLETGTKDVHSGLTGGAARNPLTELCAVLAKCVKPKTGKVKIPGFYDDVAKPSKKELESFARSGFSVAEFKRAHGLKSLRHQDAMAVMRAIWAEPTFEIHGIAGGYQGPGVKTAVPPWAEAKISMRLVPDQSPKKAFAQLKAFVKSLNPHVVVSDESSLAPYRGATGGPFVDAAIESFAAVYGKKPAFVREGGSIGAVVTMEKLLACPIHFIGLSLPEHGYHAPNEFFDWGQASGGMRVFVEYFDRIARIARRRSG